MRGKAVNGGKDPRAKERKMSQRCVYVGYGEEKGERNPPYEPHDSTFKKVKREV